MTPNRKSEGHKPQGRKSQRSKSGKPRPKGPKVEKAELRSVSHQVPDSNNPARPRPILPESWRVNALAFLLLTLATIGLYAGDLHLDFLSLDDPGYVTDNPWIRGVSIENLRHILGAPYFANYSPLH